MPLQECKIRFVVLRRFIFDPGLLCRRKLGLQFVRDLLSEIGLNRKDVGQIAVIIIRPEMFVGSRID